MSKQTIVNSFISGNKMKYNSYATDGNFLSLHGNVIAKKENGKISICLQGWNTHTTKTTLNLISGCNIRQKNWELFLNDKPINSNDWYEL
tara:strand:- start:248 stop:517 length:270 start_codon:yes stop_codon:yes gene_type:complete